MSYLPTRESKITSWLNVKCTLTCMSCQRFSYDLKKNHRSPSISNILIHVRKIEHIHKSSENFCITRSQIKQIYFHVKAVSFVKALLTLGVTKHVQKYVSYPFVRILNTHHWSVTWIAIVRKNIIWLNTYICLLKVRTIFESFDCIIFAYDNHTLPITRNAHSESHNVRKFSQFVLM